jgi:hypothetical protein
MLMLVNNTFTKPEAFANEEELWVHIRKKAYAKAALGTTPEEQWRFAYHPHHTLIDFLENRDNELFQKIAEQACAEEEQMLVIRQGDPKTAFFALATPELDTDKLKRNWCKAYAKNHGLRIL